MDGAGAVITDCFLTDQNNYPIPGVGTRVVMGRIGGSENWQRGGRGWGSAPPTNPGTLFQINPTVIPDGRPQDEEIDEATADMFLNWVFRRTTDNFSDFNDSPCDPPQVFVGGVQQSWQNIQGTWEGFQNIDELGIFDTFSLPQTDNNGNAIIDPITGQAIVDVYETLPGNTRYWWMEQTMNTIFAQPTLGW